MPHTVVLRPILECFSRFVTSYTMHKFSLIATSSMGFNGSFTGTRSHRPSPEKFTLGFILSSLLYHSDKYSIQMLENPMVYPLLSVNISVNLFLCLERCCMIWLAKNFPFGLGSV